MTVTRWGYDGYYYEPSRPLKAKGGVKTRTRRGTFGDSWWARRWIEVLEGFGIGERLARGRAYARKGQVLSVDVEEGVVRARVQGSRVRPYAVVIKVKTLSATEWKRVARSLSSQTDFVAALLAERMPEDIETAFEAAGVSLFPARRCDLHTDCSCPDWSNPCKHVAAVYYLLAEEFDRVPFLIFRLRGMTRERLVQLIGGAGGGGAAAGRFAGPEAGQPTPGVEPLPADPSLFWSAPDESGAGSGAEVAVSEATAPEVAVPAVAAALVKRTGGFPFWRGDEEFTSAMEQVYRCASPLGMDVLAGDWRPVANPGQSGHGAASRGGAAAKAAVVEPTPQAWKSLYLACGQFRSLAPWDWMDDSQVIGVEDPSSGQIGWCVVMGNARETFGLWICRGAHGYAGYALMASGMEPDFDAIAKMDYLSLSYGDKRELDRKDLDLIQESGLKPRGRNAWPLLRAKAPWRPPWWLNAGEAEFMTLALGQVCKKAIELKLNPRTRLVKGAKLLVRKPIRTDSKLQWRDAWVEPGVPAPEGVTVAPNAREIDAIRKRAPVTGEIWEADVFPLKALVEKEGIPYYPMTLLVVTRGGSPVVHFKASEPGPGGWQFLSESFVEGLKKAGRTPRQLRVARPEVAGMLAPLCAALGVKLKEVERLSVLESVKWDFEDYLQT
jgi:uncharacterized Zn finger protein